ncbi:MAG: aminopeptidase [Candidatus [Bacteroides] periocalifornicus]|uniref:Aminopeptidase n=1 Tax=Candidatus [Bacteroides] periocalifornicus TaxID=1702214 RepID=A0A0Q4B9R3_9BACT|nr:MAG: aminopeptidase [Candidatus [Bacteroides] periocalifornicus]
MKRLVCTMATIALLAGGALQAQEGEKKGGFQFTDEVTVSTTSVKDQNRAGTCWSYSGLGFFESELLRMKKGEYDLSEMFIVRNTYHDKAVDYVRYHGTMEFAGGGSFKDVVEVLRKHGIVPEEVYKGLNYGEDNHVHGELDAVTKAYVNAVIENSNKHLSTAWLRGYDGILNAYLGVPPTEFTYKGKKYTPKSYMESLGLNLDDYTYITSWTHHPFYQLCKVEIPDNWRRGDDWNVQLDEMMAIIDNSLKNGYPVAWGSDVSEKGFKWRKGVAVIPAKEGEETAGAEVLKWAEMSKEDREKALSEINGPVPEKKITQEMRQLAFDNWETTDDHGMVIVGIAKDQNGNKYYKVKNSWTASGPYKGYFYASEAFVRYKTIDIMVNKKGIPAEIAKKLKL